MAGDGYDIVALDVAAPLAYPPYPMGSSAELDSLRRRVEALGRACLPVVADVRDFDAVARRGERPPSSASARSTSCSTTRASAPTGYAHELTEPEWDAMLDINLKGAVDRRPPRDPGDDRGQVAA